MLWDRKEQMRLGGRGDPYPTRLDIGSVLYMYIVQVYTTMLYYNYMITYKACKSCNVNM